MQVIPWRARVGQQLGVEEVVAVVILPVPEAPAEKPHATEV